jgi:phosphate starvation-inducible protein PhoH and related proteins
MPIKKETTGRKTAKKRNNPDEQLSTKHSEKFRIELTKPQKEIVNFLKQNKVSLVTGESGTSKDTICFYRGLDAILNKEYEKLIVVRPLVQSGTNLGFLKGDLSEKTQPYEDFYQYHLSKILNKADLDRIKSKIEFETTQFSRGKNWEYSFIIVSESQSFTLHELFTLVTRVSESSIIVFNGDYELQNDIGNKSGYKDFINILKDIEDIDYVHLGDEFQMRSQLIVKINREHKKFLNTKK